MVVDLPKRLQRWACNLHVSVRSCDGLGRARKVSQPPASLGPNTIHVPVLPGMPYGASILILRGILIPYGRWSSAACGSLALALTVLYTCGSNCGWLTHRARAPVREPRLLGNETSNSSGDDATLDLPVSGAVDSLGPANSHNDVVGVLCVHEKVVLCPACRFCCSRRRRGACGQRVNRDRGTPHWYFVLSFLVRYTGYL